MARAAPLLALALVLLCALSARTPLSVASSLADDADEPLVGWKGSSYNSAEGRPIFEAEREARELAARGHWVEHLSFAPQAKLFHNFLSDEECDALKAQAEPTMQRSTVVDSVTGQVKTDPIRTSYQTFLVRRSSAIVTKIDERVARFTGLPWYHGEDMQVRASRTRQLPRLTRTEPIAPSERAWTRRRCAVSVRPLAGAVRR